MCRPARTWLVTLIMLALWPVTMNAQTNSITLNAKKASLESVLENIERQTDYRFFYSRNVIDINTPVSIEGSGMTINQTLDKLFATTDITYVINKKQIVLNKANSADASTPTDKKINVTGRVSDSTGEPLVGVTVTASGMQGGTTTNLNGDYEISVPAGATIHFSYVGCSPAERKVTHSGTLDVILDNDNNVLNEVVVMGYGVQKKKLVTGSTINIKGDEILKQNSTSALGALYSQVPGVSIVQKNGQPNAGFNINIRGLGTTGDSSPLYVIDGIAGADINSLNPADIEAIDILKDAASCAIYGSRAANGVVLVTTRQGRKGKVNVSYDGYYSIQQANLNGVKSVTGLEYIDLVNRSFVSKGTINEGENIHDWAAIMPKQYAMLKSGQWQGTDWLKEYTNDNAPAYNNAVSIDGGNDLARFSLGFTNTYSEGTLGNPKPPKYERTTVRVNTDFTIWRRGSLDIIKVGENATFSKYSSNSVSQGNLYDNKLHDLLVLTPLLPAYNQAGEFYTYADQLADNLQLPSGGYNMLEDNALRSYDYRRFRLQTNFWLEIAPHQDWKFRSVYGYNYYNSNNRTYTPAYELSSKDYSQYDRVQQEASTSTFWTWENTLQWIHSFGRHNIDVLIGTSMEQRGWGQSVGAWRKDTKFGTWESANLSSSDSAIDPEMVSVWGGNTIPYKKIISYFGRVNYNYAEKYLASVILRRDGSSNFARGHRFGTFPSVSAGWILSNEPWMEEASSWIDFLKIRGSWGRNGNCNIDNFQYLATVSLDAPYDFTTGGTSIATGAYPDIIPNENLTWEKSEQIDLGIDARFLRQRLVASLGWYRKTTRDWLVDAPTLDSYGTGSPVINGGSVRNQGFELSLSWYDRIADFNYSVNVNLATNSNKVTSINNSDGIIHGNTNVISQNLAQYNTYEARTGYPIGYFTGIASEGIFQNQAQIDSYRDKGYSFIDGYEKARPGDVIWIDQNEDGSYNDEDVVMIGNPHPDITLGLNISMNYKGFDLSVSGSGAFGQQVLQSYRSFANSDYDNYTNNFVARCWTGEGSTNSFPRFTDGSHNNFKCNGYVGDIWVQDADYFKIRTITLGYDFKHLFRSLPLQQLRLYVSGQNLFTFTKYDGFDPEVGYGGGDSWSAGIDIGSYPSPKAYTFGLNVKF